MNGNGVGCLLLVILGVLVFFTMFGGLSGMAMIFTALGYILGFGVGFAIVAIVLNKLGGGE